MLSEIHRFLIVFSYNLFYFHRNNFVRSLRTILQRKIRNISVEVCFYVRTTGVTIKRLLLLFHFQKDYCGFALHFFYYFDKNLIE